MAYRIRFNKGRSSKFRKGSRVRQTPEEGRRTCRPKRCGNNNKDEDNSPKTLNDKTKSNHFDAPERIDDISLSNKNYKRKFKKKLDQD